MTQWEIVYFASQRFQINSLACPIKKDRVIDDVKDLCLRLYRVTAGMVR